MVLYGSTTAVDNCDSREEPNINNISVQEGRKSIHIGFNCIAISSPNTPTEMNEIKRVVFKFSIAYRISRYLPNYECKCIMKTI